MTRFKTSSVQFRADGDGLEEGQFLVYPSTFTKKPDAYGDVVAPGAFADTIAEWKDSGNVMPGLYGHRMDDPDYSVAYALDMGEDEYGWWVKGQFDLDSPKAEQVYRLVKSKRLNQLSFAFDVKEEGLVELDDGSTANELRKLKVYEFSFVPVGANQDTSIVAVKSAVEVLAGEVKSGRVISTKNEETLRSAYEQLDAAVASIKSVIEQIDTGTAESDESKAKGKEPTAAKPEELDSSKEAEAIATLIQLTALTGKEEQ